MIKIIAIIPAYNEEKSIAYVIESINSIKCEGNIKIIPLVINDASKDKTSEIALQLNSKLINLPVNLGIGGAVQTGFKYAYKNGYDFAVQVDGDGQHPAEKISDMLTIAQQDHDVVIGSRFIDKKGYKSTLIRRIGIIYFKYVIKLICGFNITDATSGFRMFNRKALKIVCDNYPDDYPEPVSFVLFKNYNLRIKEFPVSMHERKGGKSSINSFDSLYYMIKVSLAILFSFLKTK